MMGRARLLAAAVVFSLVAIGLSIREAWYLFSWPEVNATVLASRLHEESSGGQDGHPLYRPEITVRYAVNGRPQEGRATSTYWSSDRADAEAILSAFPARTQAPMRYDPSNPTELRFDAAPTFDAFKIPLLSAVAGAACALGWALTRRKPAAR